MLCLRGGWQAWVRPRRPGGSSGSTFGAAARRPGSLEEAVEATAGLEPLQECGTGSGAYRFMMMREAPGVQNPEEAVDQARTWAGEHGWEEANSGMVSRGRDSRFVHFRGEGLLEVTLSAAEGPEDVSESSSGSRDE